MKKIKRWLADIFSPEDFNGLDVDAIRSALNDTSIRLIWLSNCLDSLQQINREVDKRLLSGGSNMQLTDLCARRQAYQDILEGVLSARRQVVSGVPEQRHNPKVEVNLDRVTA